MTNKWIVKELTAEEKKYQEKLTNELGISPTLCKLLVQRGIHTMEEAKNFFRPQMAHLHNPFLMTWIKQ